MSADHKGYYKDSQKEDQGTEAVKIFLHKIGQKFTDKSSGIKHSSNLSINLKSNKTGKWNDQKKDRQDAFDWRKEMFSPEW